jgi:hypothetical protein
MFLDALCPCCLGAVGALGKAEGSAGSVGTALPPYASCHGGPGTWQPAEATARASVGLGLAALWWTTRCAWCEGSCKLPPSRNQESGIRNQETFAPALDPLPSTLADRLEQNAHARCGQAAARPVLGMAIVA